MPRITLDILSKPAHLYRSNNNRLSGGAVVSNSYAYNKRRLPVQETMAPDALNTWSLTYGYNANGHLASHGYPAGLTTAYTVNALGQVTQITAQDVTTVNVVSNASYFPNGAIQSFTYGNGITHSATQNTRGLPLRTTDCAGGGICHPTELRLDLEYGYDRNGNVSNILDHTAGGRQTRAMGYDTLDRLTQVTSSMFGTASYDYDVQDNLTRVQVGTSALHPARDHWYCYSNNRLGTVRTGSCSGGIVSSLGYDVQGNITSKGSQSFGFDYGNRLRDSGGVSQYLYDGHGRRVRYTGTGAAPYLYSQYDQTGKLRWQRDEQTGQRIRLIYLGNRLVARHTFELLELAESLFAHRRDRVQAWANFCRDTADNAIYLHSENPNGSAFPHAFAGVRWGLEQPYGSLPTSPRHEFGQFFDGERGGTIVCRLRN